MKNKTSLKSIVVLVVICLLIAVAMAAVNAVTAPKIEEANERAEQEALAAVLPDNGGFERIELEELPESVSAVYRDADGEGYVVMLSIKGYDSSKPMSAAVGFTNGGEITELKMISAQGETSGIGSKVTLSDFTDRFRGLSSESPKADAISGATISSSAVISAVEDSFKAFEMAREVR